MKNKNEIYIHLQHILEYIAAKEKVEFQIVKSEDYNIGGINAFKVIIPKSFKVESIKLEDNDDVFFNFEILDAKGNNATEGPIIILWDSELYSTKKEKNICLPSEGIDNGVLIFEGFKNIPEIVSSSEIIKYSKSCNLI